MTLASRAIVCFVSLLILAETLCAQPPISGRIEFTDDVIETVDRTTITVHLTHPAGAVIEPWTDSYAASLSEAGWTLIRVTESAPTLEGPDLISASVSYLVEPFLSGVYSVPELSLLGRTPEDGTLESSIRGGEIEVGSVLTDGEAGPDPLGIQVDPVELGKATAEESTDDQSSTSLDESDAPLGSLAEPPALPEPSSELTILISSVGGVCVVFVLIWWITRSRPSAPRREDPVRTLKALAKLDAPTVEDLSRAHACIETLVNGQDLIVRIPDELASRLEHARYAPEKAGVQERTGLIADAYQAARTLGATADPETGGAAP